MLPPLLAPVIIAAISYRGPNYKAECYILAPLICCNKFYLSHLPNQSGGATP